MDVNSMVEFVRQIVLGFIGWFKFFSILQFNNFSQIL